MNRRELRKALKKAVQDPDWDENAPVMVRVGEEDWRVVASVEEGGTSPLFPFLTLKEA